MSYDNINLQVRKSYPYLTSARFPHNWAIADMVKGYIAGTRKELNRQAREAREEREHGGRGEKMNTSHSSQVRVEDARNDGHRQTAKKRKRASEDSEPNDDNDRPQAQPRIKQSHSQSSIGATLTLGAGRQHISTTNTATTPTTYNLKKRQRPDSFEVTEINEPSKKPRRSTRTAPSTGVRGNQQSDVDFNNNGSDDAMDEDEDKDNEDEEDAYASEDAEKDDDAVEDEDAEEEDGGSEDDWARGGTVLVSGVIY